MIFGMPSSKYHNIRPVIDSGYNTRKQLENLESLAKYFKIRADETFKRIGVNALVALLIEVAELERFRAPDSSEATAVQPAPVRLERGSSANREDRALAGANSNTLGEESKMATLLRGVTAIDAKIQKREAALLRSPFSRRPYILLDVRERDDYQKLHIKTSLSLPGSRLSRSMWDEDRLLTSFKNVPDKVIILYDDDEIHSARAASVLVQRGFENCFILSGGMSLARKTLY
ncbi:unnamed protein product [Cyprideis torosa]|uniref:Uncharacterized protein n=1 Tax=Cyprideis torosa TaxID=163714 RepID=A0A7R8ZKM4_9CRUS|nr:unnamed protein product [Cyprideis torosa]CAG0891354.1 unnamed protein product [Cyprideis torosa]